MKFISPKVHGVIDYLVVIFLFASPTFFGFTGILATFTYALGIVHLLLTILTNYPLGIIKVIPVSLHATIELLVGIALIALAYILFSKNADGYLFYVIFGTVVLLTWLVTDYKGVKSQAL
jgi:hypothetical protein